MTSAVLRVSSERLDLDECLAWLPEGNVDAIWRAGDQRIGGGVHTKSGFNLLLSEGEETAAAVDEALASFLAVAPQVAGLVQGGISVTIDFGLFISGADDSSIGFHPEFLRCLGEHGVRLVVSPYLCSD